MYMHAHAHTHIHGKGFPLRLFRKYTGPGLQSSSLEQHRDQICQTSQFYLAARACFDSDCAASSVPAALGLTGLTECTSAVLIVTGM